ncbi:hypothetical protein PITC_028430 [Penicillium italicum]|uniref:Uncharacterized protein n=1 Tax=Penicillium italicum TaxID=40296 RepID=A0A0A2L5E3_PENIT|nr:hypothetical protein PITC_028430 [Penicillium italicum]
MPAAYKPPEKSKGDLDHWSRGLRRTCRHCCWTHFKSSGTLHQVRSVDILHKIRNHL